MLGGPDSLEVGTALVVSAELQVLGLLRRANRLVRLDETGPNP